MGLRFEVLVIKILSAILLFTLKRTVITPEDHELYSLVKEAEQFIKDAENEINLKKSNQDVSDGESDEIL